MADRAYNLAIETSGPLGSVTLGRGDQVVESAQLPPQTRHTVDLMPVIDRVCKAHSVAPENLGEVYISVGPGSFTGLRIGVTTAKMLAQVLGVQVVAVPTLDVVAQNAPPPTDKTTRLGVVLNVKNETAYTGLFKWDAQGWHADTQPMLATLRELLDSSPRPLLLLGNPLPPLPEPAPPGVTLLPGELAVARSEVVWRLGRAKAKRGEFTDPLALLPLYARRPEAEELWEKRHGVTDHRPGSGAPSASSERSIPGTPRS